MTATTKPAPIDAGLGDVVAAATRLSSVNGQQGELIIGGYPLESFAAQASFVEAAYLLWHGRRPDPQELAQFKQTWAGQQTLPAPTLTLLQQAAASGALPMAALRLGVASLTDYQDSPSPAELVADATSLAAKLPALIASYWRFSQGQEPLAPRPDLSPAANLLYLLDGELPSQIRQRSLETYLNTVVDHGLNASTFTARVIISTGSDLASAITGAIGALKGPRHGGAPGPALDTVLAIDRPEEARAYLGGLLDRGERLMGFGHRVYKVYDPRAVVLARAAAALYQDEKLQPLYQKALAVEREAIQLLEERKPGRNLQTNVEFYTALLLHGLGIPKELFPTVFAMSRVVGWVAHCREQLETGRIVRPKSIYVGPHHPAW